MARLFLIKHFDYSLAPIQFKGALFQTLEPPCPNGTIDQVGSLRYGQ